MPRMTTAFARRPTCAPAEVSLCCWRPYCAAIATKRRPHCALLERRYHSVCFEDGQSACRRSAFYAIPQRPLAMPLCWCGDACDRPARTSSICIFLERRRIAVRTLLWCDRAFRAQRIFLWSQALWKIKQLRANAVETRLGVLQGLKKSTFKLSKKKIYTVNFNRSTSALRVRWVALRMFNRLKLYI